MRIINSYKEAYGLLQETQPHLGDINDPKVQARLVNGNATRIGINIGKQFGTNITMWIAFDVAFYLLKELEKRDLPLPLILQHNNRILIGADTK